ncbi:MAG: hypothetical protein ACXW2A_05575 [Burkholderiales bacterium]
MRRTFKDPAGALLCLVLLGCGTPYRQTVETGYRYNWDSTLRPPEVARCIIARTEAQRPWRVLQRPLDERGSIELVIGSGGEGVAAVARVAPSPYGSRIESWLTSRAVLTRDIWHEQFFGGC